MAFNRVSKVDDRVAVRRVLVSVYDKTGLEEFALGMVDATGGEVEFYSTGGTHEALKAVFAKAGKGRLTSVAEYTGQPEMQGGLVKTLDFKIYLGILSEPYNPAHDADRARTASVLFDLVCVNLYPFAAVLSRGGADAEELRQNIDIGGPCMLRAASKAYLRVAAVSGPGEYGPILNEMSANAGSLGLRTRKDLAERTFKAVSEYDAAIASWFGGLSAPGSAYGLS
jgi:phosphoribosylaminoimidazolecarboxamide formyltransferase/IMP cyclohydrolase